MTITVQPVQIADIFTVLVDTGVAASFDHIAKVIDICPVELERIVIAGYEGKSVDVDVEVFNVLTEFLRKIQKTVASDYDNVVMFPVPYKVKIAAV